MSNSNMIKARNALINLQRFLGEWSADLNRFLGHISQQNQKLNRNWNDPRQALYHKSWGVFEEQQKKNHKIAQSISVDLQELSKSMAIYLKQNVHNKQAFERLKQVQGLTGWPASARQPVEVVTLAGDIKDYKKILDNFRQGLKAHLHKIIQELGNIQQSISAPKVNACRVAAHKNIKSWLLNTEKSTDMLSGFIDEIHTDLSRLI